MYPIKQNTAETILFFVHDSGGDGVTGLADGGFTKRISKGSGAFAAMTVTITELENGWYSFPLSTTHSNTLGLLTVSFSNPLAKRVNLQWRVSVRTLDELASFDTSAAALTELSQAQPPATPRPDQALMLLYMALRNASTTTSTTYTIANAAGTVTSKSALTDDGVTFTRAQQVSGP